MRIIFDILHFIISSFMLSIIVAVLVLAIYIIGTIAKEAFRMDINMKKLDSTAFLGTLFFIILSVLIIVNLLYAVNNGGDFYYIIELFKKVL